MSLAETIRNRMVMEPDYPCMQKAEILEWAAEAEKTQGLLNFIDTALRSCTHPRILREAIAFYKETHWPGPSAIPPAKS